MVRVAREPLSGEVAVDETMIDGVAVLMGPKGGGKPGRGAGQGNGRHRLGNQVSESPFYVCSGRIRMHRVTEADLLHGYHKKPEI